jgi:hypothetical protein
MPFGRGCSVFRRAIFFAANLNHPKRMEIFQEPIGEAEDYFFAANISVLKNHLDNGFPFRYGAPSIFGREGIVVNHTSSNSRLLVLGVVVVVRTGAAARRL